MREHTLASHLLHTNFGIFASLIVIPTFWTPRHRNADFQTLEASCQIIEHFHASVSRNAYVRKCSRSPHVH